MNNKFPKLQSKLNEIENRLNEVLRTEFIDIDTALIEDVELKVNLRNFIPHTATTKLSNALNESLKESLEPAAKVTVEDVSAAQALLKFGRHNETAIKVLTKAVERKIHLQEAKESAKEARDAKNLAIKAMSECASEIAKFDKDQISKISRHKLNLFFDGKTRINTEDGEQSCDVDDEIGIAYCDYYNYTKNSAGGLWMRIS